MAAYRAGDLDEAIQHLERAVDIDSTNPYAHRNLASALGKAGKLVDAVRHYRRAVDLNPSDQMALLGLAQALFQQEGGGDTEPDELLLKAIDLAPDTSAAETARAMRCELAQRGFRAKSVGGIRPDAIMYCLAALERFDAMSVENVRKVAFEIAMLGRSGLVVNDPEKTYTLQSIPGQSFSGLQLVSTMYVGFKRIDPATDVGFDLSKEYEAALSLHGKRR